ncbi:MAG: aspartate/tyrosine/aromatic aminotransferase [Candidatus Lambdaproteobacteria bacterium]|nr:aspartate/tyrosine/aromatic aminotransferase [Candidatus Lambdaproteobacteria bacterium]
MAPADPILGLTEQFKRDPNPNKINLSIGVYQDESGVNPVLKSVKQAERLWQEQEHTKEYLPMPGEQRFGELVRDLVFGARHPLLAQQRAVTVQAPGGTGALRVAADFLYHLTPKAKVWISEPTWPVHRGLFAGAGFAIETYPYYDDARHALRFEELLATLERVPEGDIVLLHACCHNPTGLDPTAAEWQRLAEVFARRPILPLLDFAYQGFGDGLEEDALAVRTFAQADLTLLVTTSLSKNFGLYRERVGALTVVSGSADEAERVFSQLKVSVRTIYSNPPAHGGKVAEIVLCDPALRTQWLAELAEMRERIQAMRHLLVESARKAGVQRKLDFLLEQRGMFSFSGIPKEQVLRLRAEYGIYLMENGRINVAGLTRKSIPYFCQALAAVERGRAAAG